MRQTILIYAVAWASIKFATFAKDWDILSVSIAAAALIIVGTGLWNGFLSLLANGKREVAYISVMVLGAITFICDEFFHIGWYISFGNKSIDMIVGWTLFAGVAIFLFKIFYLIFFGERETEE